VLRRFTPQRGPLLGLLLGVARKLVSRYCRRFERHKERQLPLLEVWFTRLAAPDASFEPELDSFRARLTPEQQALFDALRGQRSEQDLALNEESRRQLKRRIYVKWLEFRDER
jgi:hypothetical protein